jgi:hypothetical protein
MRVRLDTDADGRRKRHFGAGCACSPWRDELAALAIEASGCDEAAIVALHSGKLKAQNKPGFDR